MSNEKQDYILDEIKERIIQMDILINKSTGIEKDKWTNVKDGLLLSIDCVYSGTINYLKREKIGEQSDFSKQILNQ